MFIPIVLKSACPNAGLNFVKRFYARGNRRRIVDVVPNEISSKSQLNRHEERMPLESRPNGHSLFDQAASDRFRLPSSVKFEILGGGNKKFGPVMMACKNRKARHKKKQILLEGTRLINDAITARANIKALYFCTMDALKEIPEESLHRLQLYKVPRDEFDLWSDVVTSTGLMAVCEIPETKPRTENVLPLSLICDNIRDPGNMGTLLRSALAVGCRTVFTTKGCVDVWEPKVLRSGMGAHFSLHILTAMQWELLGNYLTPGTNVYLADHHAGAPPRRVSQRVIKRISELEHEVFTEVDEETSIAREVDSGYLNQETVQLFKGFPLTSGSVYDADFTQGEAVLVIGGETEGLSAEAHKLAYDRNGEKVTIPICSDVDSLNSAMAATVIMFEMKRQVSQTGRYSRHTDTRK